MLNVTKLRHSCCLLMLIRVLCPSSLLQVCLWRYWCWPCSLFRWSKVMHTFSGNTYRSLYLPNRQLLSSLILDPAGLWSLLLSVDFVSQASLLTHAIWSDVLKLLGCLMWVSDIILGDNDWVQVFQQKWSTVTWSEKILPVGRRPTCLWYCGNEIVDVLH